MSEEEERVRLQRTSALPTAAIRKEAFRRKFTGLVFPGKCLRRDEFKGFDIYESFERLGWAGVFEFEHYYYPQVVEEFMTNLRLRSHKSLKSRVNNRSVTITLQDVRELLNVDVGGNHICSWNDLEMNEQCVSYLVRITNKTVEAIAALGMREGRVTNMDLTLKARIFFEIVRDCIVPRSSSPSTVKNKDVYILHALLTGEPRLSFATIFMECLWDAYDDPKKGFIPFGCLLSKLLERKGVARETRITVSGKVIDEGDDRIDVSRGVFIRREAFSNLKFTYTSSRMLRLRDVECKLVEDIAQLGQYDAIVEWVERDSDWDERRGASARGSQDRVKIIEEQLRHLRVEFDARQTYMENRLFQMEQNVRMMYKDIQGLRSQLDSNFERLRIEMQFMTDFARRHAGLYHCYQPVPCHRCGYQPYHPSSSGMSSPSDHMEFSHTESSDQASSS